MTDVQFEILTGQIQAISMGLTAVMTSLSPGAARSAAAQLEVSMEIENESREKVERLDICRQLVEAYVDLLKNRAGE